MEPNAPIRQNSKGTLRKTEEEVQKAIFAPEFSLVARVRV
jgi:hypothetical protein